MKIGILIDRFNVGGVEKIALEQVIALNKIGINTELIVLSRNAVVEDAFLELRKHVSISYLDDKLPKALKSSFKFPFFHFFSLFHLTYPFLLPFVMKNNTYDYIISHGTFTTFSAISFKLFLKIPFSAFIWDPIGYILIKVYSNTFNKYFLKILTSIAYVFDYIILKFADEILVGGNAHNNYFKKLYKHVKITVVYPSVHLNKSKKSKYISDVLLVTAWKKGKNPEYIFEVLKHLPNTKVCFVGKWIDKNYKKQFLSEIKKSRFSKNISIIGSVTEKQLSKYYLNSKILLQINDDRGFGMPALEAAASGTPFIIPKNQGVCALFENGIHGYFVKEKDTKNIVKYMDRLLSSDKIRNKMGNKAYSLVKNQYNWQSHAKLLNKIVVRNS